MSVPWPPDDGGADDAAEAAPLPWRLGPDAPNQYTVEGTIERMGAFAAGAHSARGVRGVVARVGAGAVLTGLLAGLLLGALQALTLLR